jgi:hypothetical protein
VRRRLNQLVSEYFEGSPNALVNFLVAENDLSQEDLKKLLKSLEKDAG